jgi:biotin carboxyl carrier protein
MPGLVVAVPVEEGQLVARGDALVILESMKMQNELKAPRQGTVAQVRVRPGERVELNQVLMTLG